MIHIDKPTFSVRDVFECCISNFRDIIFKSKLNNVTNFIETSTLDYDLQAEGNSLNSISPSLTVNGTVSTSEMTKVYNDKLVKKGQPGRPYYERLRLSAKNNICPFCNQRVVTTLDHILPKSKYPTFAISPVNLTPACADCNKFKDTYEPNRPEEELLHPYFDNISSSQYLFSELKETDPPSLIFYIQTSDPETIMEKRLKKHFSIFKLNELYISNSAQELSNISQRLTTLHSHCGIDCVRDYLIEEYESRFAYNKNSWHTAMYLTLSQSDWFCDGGFRME